MHFIFLTSGILHSNLCHFKPLGSWSFATAVVESGVPLRDEGFPLLPPIGQNMSRGHTAARVSGKCSPWLGSLVPRGAPPTGRWSMDFLGGLDPPCSAAQDLRMLCSKFLQGTPLPELLWFHVQASNSTGQSTVWNFVEAGVLRFQLYPGGGERCLIMTNNDPTACPAIL